MDELGWAQGEEEASSLQASQATCYREEFVTGHFLSRDFRCLMSDGMERHPTLSRAERKLILFGIYKIGWFVI